MLEVNVEVVTSHDELLCYAYNDMFVNDNEAAPVKMINSPVLQC